MDEAPKIEVHILPNVERSTGAGEPATPPVALALGHSHHMVQRDLQ
ncbi:MAG: CO/xanthine dehydrogenase Mo-binding subunit [Patiriisocius sp.]|jgi:CO/xanthine dehydrogenase Mo-binding subunit